MKRFISVLAVFLSITAPLFASCGSASCPIDIYSMDRTEKGFVRVDYSYEYIDQNQPRIGRQAAAVGEIRGHHDEVYTLNQTQRLGIDVGLASRWNLQLVLPFVHREHDHIHHHMGANVNESWNFNGMGDLTLLNRIGLNTPASPASPYLAAIIGGVLPTGREQAQNADGDDAEIGILPGKGAYSLILGVSESQSFKAKTLNGLYARVPIFVSSTYQWNGKGTDDYRVGDIWLANIGVTYPLLPRLGFINQLNFRVNLRDDKGNTREEVEKTGGSYLYFSPGIQLTFAENLWSYMIVQLPLYQRVNGIQLTSDSNFLLGMSYKFSAL